MEDNAMLRGQPWRRGKYVSFPVAVAEWVELVGMGTTLVGVLIFLLVNVGLGSLAAGLLMLSFYLWYEGNTKEIRFAPWFAWFLFWPVLASFVWVALVLLVGLLG